MTSTTRKWLHGLSAAFIGGGATAITAQTGLATAQTAGLDVHPLNWKALGIVALSAGIYSAAAYLRQSPLPAEETTTTVTVTAETTKKENPS